jgi:hypothetical protein
LKITETECIVSRKIMNWHMVFLSTGGSERRSMPVASKLGLSVTGNLAKATFREAADWAPRGQARKKVAQRFPEESIS